MDHGVVMPFQPARRAIIHQKAWAFILQNSPIWIGNERNSGRFCNKPGYLHPRAPGRAPWAIAIGIVICRGIVEVTVRVIGLNVSKIEQDHIIGRWRNRGSADCAPINWFPITTRYARSSG